MIPRTYRLWREEWDGVCVGGVGVSGMVTARLRGVDGSGIVAVIANPSAMRWTGSRSKRGTRPVEASAFTQFQSDKTRTEWIRLP